MPDFKLPDLGEGMAEAEIDRWLVSEGDSIAEDDPLVEVITDKATAEIPSPYEGVVERIHVSPGQIATVGTVLVSIRAPGESPSAGGTGAGGREGTEVEAIPPAGLGERDEAEGGRDESDVKAMPPVRTLARTLGVDLTDVKGSGPSGQVMRADVERAASATAAGEAGEPGERDDPGEQGADRREPLRGVRRTIAERMAEAHRAVPAVTHVEECDVTELDATRRLANEQGGGAAKLTFLPFIVKAAVAGLKAFPAMNASLDESAEEIVYHNRYDIGFAVDAPAGLTVPVIRDADRRSVTQIASDIESLAARARSGSLQLDDMRGATFTITSPGPFGGVMATPIVFHPQSAILGVHRATERAVVRDGNIVVRKIMNLSITFDHRVLDGMTAARFALGMVDLLEHPAGLAGED